MLSFGYYFQCRRKYTFYFRKSSLKVYYTNCRSIVNKIDFLRGLTSVENLDIIALTETWLNMSGKIFSPEVERERNTSYFKKT